MGEMTNIRNRLKREKHVKVWFWDGQREYSGMATELSVSSVLAKLRITDIGDETAVPGPYLLEALRKYLLGKSVEMKLSRQSLEVSVRANVLTIEQDSEDRRRANLTADFIGLDERRTTILEKLSQE